MHQGQNRQTTKTRQEKKNKQTKTDSKTTPSQPYSVFLLATCSWRSWSRADVVSSSLRRKSEAKVCCCVSFCCSVSQLSSLSLTCCSSSNTLVGNKTGRESDDDDDDDKCVCVCVCVCVCGLQRRETAHSFFAFLLLHFLGNSK